MGPNISLERLQLNRRLVRYRGYADDALRQATQSQDPDTRRACLVMAAQWSALASEIENVAKQFDAVGCHAGAPRPRTASRAEPRQ
jgi:hypothetical protein